jgi:hydroxyacylglutathione hydrolase
MAAETEIRTFLCRSDNIGVLIRDPATGACAAIDVPEADPVLRALSMRPAGGSPTSS